MEFQITLALTSSSKVIYSFSTKVLAKDPNIIRKKILEKNLEN